MFEGLVERLLRESFGGIFEQIGDLKIAVWSGNVRLRDLRIKKTALAELQSVWGVGSGDDGAVGGVALEVVTGRVDSLIVEVAVAPITILIM
eukprot:jgi/Bigna1/134478/aug1.25_g9186